MTSATLVRMDDLKAVRAALVNALLWGGAWGVATVILVVVLVVTGMVPAFPTRVELVHLLTSLGLTGAFTGAFFSGVLRFAYRGRDLLGINSVLFALTGAATAGLISPFVGGMPLIAIPLGGLTAGMTLAMAKGAERRLLVDSPGAPMLEGEAIRTPSAGGPAPRDG